MMWLLGALLFSWVVCGLLSYATFFAFFQREYPCLAKKHYRDDRIAAAASGLLGPIGLFVTATTFGFKHGMKWK